MTNSNLNPKQHSNCRILHPTDLTEKDVFPFQVACALARGLNAELTVLHVAPLANLVQIPGYRSRIENQLDLLRVSNPQVKITTLLLSGDPASEIVGWAEETQPCAIVMRRSQEKWLVGRLISSVSQRVKKQVLCPVVAVAGGPVPWHTNEARDQPIKHFIEPVRSLHHSPSVVDNDFGGRDQMQKSYPYQKLLT